MAINIKGKPFGLVVSKSAKEAYNLSTQEGNQAKMYITEISTNNIAGESLEKKNSSSPLQIMIAGQKLIGIDTKMYQDLNLTHITFGSSYTTPIHDACQLVFSSDYGNKALSSKIERLGNGSLSTNSSLSTVAAKLEELPNVNQFINLGSLTEEADTLKLRTYANAIIVGNTSPFSTAISSNVLKSNQLYIRLAQYDKGIVISSQDKMDIAIGTYYINNGAKNIEKKGSILQCNVTDDGDAHLNHGLYISSAGLRSFIYAYLIELGVIKS